MSSDYTCVRPENQIIITILEYKIQRITSRYYVPQAELPFVKAMKKISKINFIIQNEFHATAIDGIGPIVGEVIASGLKTYGQYNRGEGKISETRKCQAAIIKQMAEQRENRTNKKTIPISKLYIPRKQPNGENTATRAMFIVLGLSKITKENGLEKHTIISRSRNWTDVDFSAKHDRFKVYDGFKGMETLINKEYVVHNKRAKLYRITDKGFQVYKHHCHEEVQRRLNNPMQRHMGMGMIQNQNQNRNNNRNVNRNVNRNNNRNVNRNVSRNNNRNVNGDSLENAFVEWHRQSVGGSQSNVSRNRNSSNHNVNNYNVNNEDEEMKKAILESEREAQKQLQKQIQKQSELNSVKDDNDLQLQQVLLSSLETGENVNEDEDMAEILKLIDEQEKQDTIYNDTANNNSNNSNNNNSNNSQQMYKYWCRICVPNQPYKTKGWYDKHMAEHKKNNNNYVMNDITENINNSNNKPLIPRKRIRPPLSRDDSDSEIQILPAKKKRKNNNNVLQRHKYIISNDLDTVLNGIPSIFAKDKHKNGNVFYKGKRFRLILYIDMMEQNLKSTNINELNVLEWVQSKGIHANNCQYISLANCDYIFVLSDGMYQHNMINFACERKRWDDLEQSVLVDGRGVNQKARLKKTPISRKYYLVEGNERMIRDFDRRHKCKEFLRDTEYKDGYMVKYTQSKHASMNKICEWYFKILSLLNNENGCGKELILESFSFEQFQQSQRGNGKKNVDKDNLDNLQAMGFDRRECEMALMAVENKSVQAALDYMLSRM